MQSLEKAAEKAELNILDFIIDVNKGKIRYETTPSGIYFTNEEILRVKRRLEIERTQNYSIPTLCAGVAINPTSSGIGNYENCIDPQFRTKLENLLVENAKSTDNSQSCMAKIGREVDLYIQSKNNTPEIIQKVVYLQKYLQDKILGRELDKELGKEAA